MKKLFTIFILAFILVLTFSVTAKAQPLNVGVFLPERSQSAISTFEAQVDRHQDIIMYYEAWGSPDGGNLDTERVQWILDNGSIPMITWEAWAWRITDRNYTLKTVSSGDHDAYLRKYAQQIKGVNGVVYLRPFHEMNGDWYPWCGTINGNSPEDFIPAWQHIVDIFRQEGVDNVRWVWTPNNGGLPDWDTSSISAYYPGDSYVDFAGIDGYNFGTMESWAQWESFSSVFKAAYNAIEAITDKPMIIAETASTELGGNKADWITNAFDEMTSNYPQIDTVIWFNEDKESDWRVDSSSASLAAYKAALANLDTPPVIEPEPQPEPEPPVIEPEPEPEPPVVEPPPIPIEEPRPPLRGYRKGHDKHDNYHHHDDRDSRRRW